MFKSKLRGRTNKQTTINNIDNSIAIAGSSKDETTSQNLYSKEDLSESNQSAVLPDDLCVFKRANKKPLEMGKTAKENFRKFAELFDAPFVNDDGYQDQNNLNNSSPSDMCQSQFYSASNKAIPMGSKGKVSLEKYNKLVVETDLIDPSNMELGADINCFSISEDPAKCQFQLANNKALSFGEDGKESLKNYTQLFTFHEDGPINDASMASCSSVQPTQTEMQLREAYFDDSFDEVMRTFEIKQGLTNSISTSEKPQTSALENPHTSTLENPHTSTLEMPHTSVSEKPQASVSEKPQTSQTSSSGKQQTTTSEKPQTLASEKPHTSDSKSTLADADKFINKLETGQNDKSKKNSQQMEGGNGNETDDFSDNSFDEFISTIDNSKLLNLNTSPQLREEDSGIPQAGPSSRNEAANDKMEIDFFNDDSFDQMMSNVSSEELFSKNLNGNKANNSMQTVSGYCSGDLGDFDDEGDTILRSFDVTNLSPRPIPDNSGVGNNLSLHDPLRFFSHLNKRKCDFITSTPEGKKKKRKSRSKKH